MRKGPPLSPPGGLPAAVEGVRERRRICRPEKPRERGKSRFWPWHAIGAGRARPAGRRKDFFTIRRNSSTGLTEIKSSYRRRVLIMDNLEWLHKRMRSQLSGSPRLERAADAISEFPSHASEPPARRGRTALDLVDQAAELVRNIEGHAHDIESRARMLAEDAIKKLESAEKQIQLLEQKQAAAEAYIHDIKAKFEEAREALANERARVQATENLLPQLEMRARTAEARAEECEGALARIETAIRTKILKEESSARRRAHAA